MQSRDAAAFEAARQKARAVAASGAHTGFLEMVRAAYPWRFEQLPPAVLERDYLRIVDHHLEHLIPKIARYMTPEVHRVLDFGCGSGGSAIALALVYPKVICIGTDIDPDEVRIARERAMLYGVADRCEFHCVSAGQALPFRDCSFDLCQCSSVLEYAVDIEVRRFCVREMARLLRPQGKLCCSVPNRLYPFEIHTRKWGWNYFPGLLHARTVDCTAWEVKRLARPWTLHFHQTPWVELLRPWTTFCFRRAQN
jgi:SAM-dependent methyltransferase